jgi:hypothetical protein
MLEGCTSHLPLVEEVGEKSDWGPERLLAVEVEDLSCLWAESESASQTRQVLEGQPSLEVETALRLVVLACTQRSVPGSLRLCLWALLRRSEVPRLLQPLASEG